MNTAEILSMVKIFLPKGLSARVRGAIARRLQSAMAVRADTAETTVEDRKFRHVESSKLMQSCKRHLSRRQKRRKMTLGRMGIFPGRLQSHMRIDFVSDPGPL